MHNLENLPAVLDEYTAAYLLRIPVSRLRSWRYRGRGPTFYKENGRRVRYLRDDIVALAPPDRADPNQPDDSGWYLRTARGVR